MITLEEICDRVGLVTFNRWKTEASRELRTSKYDYRSADAKHAFEYEYLVNKYNALRKSNKLMPMEEA